MDQESRYQDSCSFVSIDQLALRKTVCDRSATGLLLQLTIIALRENGDARIYNGKDLSASAWLDITPVAGETGMRPARGRCFNNAVDWIRESQPGINRSQISCTQSTPPRTELEQEPSSC